MRLNFYMMISQILCRSLSVQPLCHREITNSLLQTFLPLKRESLRGLPEKNGE